MGFAPGPHQRQAFEIHFIRKTIKVLTVLFLLSGAGAADHAGADLGALGSEVLRTVAAGASTLEIAPAGGDDNRLLWSGLRRDGRAPVLLMRYRLGAADMRAELYGVRSDAVQDNGAEMLRVYETADLRDPPKCLGWDDKRRSRVADPGGVQGQGPWPCCVTG